MDGGHNASGIAALTTILKQNKRHPIIGILGMVKGKDYQTAIKELSEVLDIVICVDDFSPQAIPAEVLVTCFPKKLKTHIMPHHEAMSFAMKIAEEANGCVVVSGSLYLSSTFLEQESIQL